MRVYHLPNGGRTNDEDEFEKAWLSLCAPMLEVTNTCLHSFDPGITMQSKSHPENGLVNLPVWFLEEFNKSQKE